MTLFRRHAGEVIMPASDKPDRLSLQVAALRLPPSHGDSMSVEAGWLSFRRIAYIPFDACVAALEGLLCEGNHGEIHVGQSRLRGPIKHDRRSGTCRVEVRLARGPLRPVLRMRLNIDRWSPPPSSTALELIPCRRVRASASYFRAGHLLMDSLIHSLRLEREMQTTTVPPGKSHRPKPSDPARAPRRCPVAHTGPRGDRRRFTPDLGGEAAGQRGSLSAIAGNAPGSSLGHRRAAGRPRGTSVRG
jgi:hypothetical protein